MKPQKQRQFEKNQFFETKICKEAGKKTTKTVWHLLITIITATAMQSKRSERDGERLTKIRILHVLSI